MTYRNLTHKVKFCLCWRSSVAEQLPCKQWVGGSNPPASASFSRGFHRMPADSGRYPSGQRGQTVNLLAYAFGGSNPPLPTTSNRAWPGTGKRGNSSAVERQPSKLGVAGSNPVSRSRFVTGARSVRQTGRAMNFPGGNAHVAQAAERVLGKDEVSGSIPDMGSTFLRATPATRRG